MMDFHGSRIDFFVLVTAALALAGKAHARQNIQSSCPGTTKQVTINLSSSLSLDKSIADRAFPERNELRKFFAMSAGQQLKYYASSVRVAAQGVGHLVVFSAEPLMIELGPQSTGNGTWNFTIDPVSHPHVKVNFPYLTESIKKKVSLSSSPHYNIAYTAKLRAMTCELKGSMPKELWEGQVPADPWLAPWLTPPSERRPVRWRHSRFSIPDYFDDEYADIPDPYYAWYFWKPGKSLNKGTQVFSSAIQDIQSETIANPGFAIDVGDWKKKTRLNATVIFGITDPQSRVLSLSNIFKVVPKTGRQKEWANLVAQIQSYLTGDDLDRGSIYASGFLTELSLVVDPATLSYSASPDGTLLTVRGSLRESRKPLNLRFYFGPTDALTPIPAPRHWAVLADAIRSDDILFYNGHSGLGENVNPERMRAELEKGGAQKRSTANSTSILIAILSCFSYTYFADSFSRPSVGRSVQLMVTGSSYTSERGPLGGLRQIDHALNGRALPYPRLRPADFLILLKED